MKKEDLIIKWLDNSLEEKELKAFEELDALSTFRRIDEGVKAFKAPSFDKEGTFQRIQSKISDRKKRYSLRYAIASIAAVAAIFLGSYFSFFQSNTTTFFAQNTEHLNLNLPDNSKVFMNSGSEISFNQDQWSDDRNVNLEGEAFFDVMKGSTFSVHTSHGTITVLGTEFNVKVRKDYFEVQCYEGLVQVVHNDNVIKLPAGSGFRAYANVTENTTVSGETHPGWMDSNSTFTSVPLAEIISELERQYNIEVTYDQSLSKTILTTSFTHKNLEAALQAITIPLKLSYHLDGNIVMLKPTPQ